MAKKKASSKAKAKSAPSPKKTAQPTSSAKSAGGGSLTARVVVDASEELGAYYVNHAEVAHSKHEFTLLCAQVPTKVSPLQRQSIEQTGDLHIDPLVQLVIPPSMIAGLISALVAQKKKYEEIFGKNLDDPAFPLNVSLGKSHAQRQH